MNPERCRACLKQTKSLKNLISLFSTQHNLTFCKILQIITNIEITDENDNFPKWICSSCEEFINSAYEFQDMCKKSNEQLELDQKFFREFEENNQDSLDESLDNINSEILEHPIKTKTQKNQSKFLCAVCGSSFGAKHSLKNHMNIHNDIRPYKCEICSKSFRHNGNLIDHKMFVHSEKTIKCNFCDKKFQTNAVLKIHLKTHNQNDRRFKCDVCNKSYFENYLLQAHKLVHTMIRHYCKICGKDYIRPMSLKRHMYTHSDVKPFACNICNYSSIEKYLVKKHMKKKHDLEYDEQINTVEN